MDLNVVLFIAVILKHLHYVWLEKVFRKLIYRTESKYEF